MRKQMLCSIAIVVLSIICCVFGAAGLTANADANTSSEFRDQLGNGRVILSYENSGNTSMELEVKDGNYSSTRAVYAKHIDLSKGFTMDLTIDALCPDGGFILAFLSGEGDYPMNDWGDGFGIRFWDETAWGYRANAALRADREYYTKGNETVTADEDPSWGVVTRYDKDASDVYLNRKLRVYVGAQDGNFLYYVYNENGDCVVGKWVQKSAIPASFNGNDCALLITPVIDSNRAHSYANNVKLSLRPNITSDTFKDVLNNGRVTTSERVTGESTVELEIKDGNYSATRAVRTKHVNLSKGFEAEISVNALCPDGGFILAFLSGENDYPMNNYGDGFGVWFYDEMSWGNYRANAALRADRVYYTKGTETVTPDTSDAWGVCSRYDTEGTEEFINKKWLLRVTDEGDNYVYYIFDENGSCVVGRYVSKSAIPASFNGNDCVLLLTPTKNDSLAHSYASNVVLTLRTYDLYNVSATAEGNGEVTATASGKMREGSKVTFTATPDEGNRVASAKINGKEVTLTDNKIDVTVTEDVVFTVTFEEIPKVYYNVEIVSGEHGTVTASAQGQVEENTSVTFAVTPDENYLVDSAKLNGETVVLNGNTYTVTITENITFAVTFKEIPKVYYTIKATAGENGKATATPDTSAEAGTEVVFTAIADNGYEVDEAKVNGTLVTLENGTYTITLSENTEFTVTFKKSIVYFDVTAENIENVTIKVSQTGRVPEGTEITFTVKAAKASGENAYKIAKATVNGEEVVAVNGEYKFTVTEDAVISAQAVLYSVDDKSGFTDGLGYNRVDAVTTDDGIVMILANTDGTRSNSRAVYKKRISLKSFETTFVVNRICLDAGFRISFLNAANQYPMETYGEALSFKFWDETAWGYNAKEALRCDMYAYSLETMAQGGQILLYENSLTRNNGSYLGAVIGLKIREESETLICEIYYNGVCVASNTVDVNDLAVDYSDCVMMITPEHCDGADRVYSFEEDVILTIKMLNVTDAEVKPPVPDDPEEYSIVYYVGDTPVRTAYAEKGETFYEYIPEDIEGFEGWYLDKECTIRFDFEVPVTGDVVVYAKIAGSSGSTGGSTGSSGSFDNDEEGCLAYQSAGAGIAAALIGIAFVVIRKKKN